MRTIELVPVSQIHVLNPRARNQRQYRAIVENIEKIGLKRPITVTRRSSADGKEEFDLVCGQGRLEAYQILGMDRIPCIVITADEEDCLVMSLVENIARRQHQAVELMREIESLHQRGYNDTEVADKLGVTASWVNMILGLLERGEERLLAAVEKGIVPVSLAVTIARSDDSGIQEALANAYTHGVVKGKKLALLRKILDQRSLRGKNERHSSGVNRKGSRKLTAENLRRIFEREVGKQQLLARTADFTQKRLFFVVQALKHLRQEAPFVAILRKEGLDTIPSPLERRMAKGGAP
ncbi:plasmid partitioning protein RepB C-terminal domain-containing protein [Dyella sp. 2RAF44]|uniref:plasmid partitioning protein RepB C-terminal domain-containing protein n=1 Tax=Dyella sp. 2RAF44 TaxID=3233000 RepID=UPI003F8EA41C